MAIRAAFFFFSVSMLLLLLLLESALAPYSQRNKALKLYYHIAEQWALCTNSHKYHVGRSQYVKTQAPMCCVWTSEQKSKRDGQHCNMFYCVHANAWSSLVSVVVHTTSSLLENVLSVMVFLSVARLCSSNPFLSLRLLHPQPTTHVVCVLCVFSSCFESMFGTTTFSYRVSQCEWIERAYLFA